MGERILITGSTGQVGAALVKTLAPRGELLTPTRAELDLADPAAIRAFLKATRPCIIVNPAAYTAVDRAETDQNEAHAINAVAPGVLGEEAARLGATVLHFSTDYVFSGEGTRPWTEQDAPAPASVYGRTKLAGEQALAASGAAHLIFRTSWVYAATGRNFLLTILKAARERPELRIVADQYGAPTSAAELARMIATVVAQPGALASMSGVYHASAAGTCTWFDFAQEFLALEQAAHPDVTFACLTPIQTADYPTPARRPANSRLDCAKLQQTFGVRLAPWRESCRAVMQERASQTKKLGA